MSSVQCTKCNEKNNPQLRVCWKCGAAIQPLPERSFQDQWTQRLKAKFVVFAYLFLVVDAFMCLFCWSMSGYNKNSLPYIFLTFFIFSLPALLVFAFMYFFRDKKGTVYQGDR